jgi:hypothetical protein
MFKKKFRNHVKILGARKVTWDEILTTSMRRHPTKFSRPEFVHSWRKKKKIHCRSVSSEATEYEIYGNSFHHFLIRSLV